jgi:hypothetical protein
MNKTINTGSALILNAQAIACVAGIIGKTLAIAILKDIAIACDLPALDRFVKGDCAAVFAADNGFPVGTGIATMQKAQPAPKGLSTLYTYYLALRKMAAKGDSAAILAATARSLTGGAAKGEPRTPKTQSTEKSVPHPLTVDDAVAFLQAAHKAGALNPLNYAALASIAPMPHPVRDMGMVINAPLMLAH